MSLYANHFGLESDDLIDIENVQVRNASNKIEVKLLLPANIFPYKRNVAHSKRHHKNLLFAHAYIGWIRAME